MDIHFHPEFNFNSPPAEDTFMQQFWAYHLKYPEVYRAIEREALSSSSRIIRMKKIFEDIRGVCEHLDNTYTRAYTDLLIERHPELEHRFNRRQVSSRTRLKVPTKQGVRG